MHGQERALAVHRDVAGASFDLLAAMQPTRLTFCCRFDGLAVQDRVAWSTPHATQCDLAPARAQHGDGLRPDAALLQRRQWSYTVSQGGKSCGRARQRQPSRRR